MLAKIAVLVLILAGCRPEGAPSGLRDAASDAATAPWLVRVSSTFRGDDGVERLKLTGYGFVVRHDAGATSRYFVVTATHLAQGGVAEVNAETMPESDLDLTIEMRQGDDVRTLKPISRLASIRRDVEIIQIEPVSGLQPLAVVRKSGAPGLLADSHPFGWLEVVDPAMTAAADATMLGAGGVYPLGRDAFIPQASFVRPALESPFSGIATADVDAAMDAGNDPWRRQVLRHGFDLSADEVATWRLLPAGFSGAPLLLKYEGRLVVFGLVTSYSRAFDMSWITPSPFITRTIDLYVRNHLDGDPSLVGVRLNDEAWKLRKGLLYRVGRYGNELGNARFTEVSFADPPAGNGSSSPGGNGSSSPGGDGSSSPGGNGSGSPGGNGSGSPGGNGSSSPSGGGAPDPMALFGITYGLDFGAPAVTGGSDAQRVLGFEIDVRALGQHSVHFAEPNLAALNLVLNSLDPKKPGDGYFNPIIRATPVTGFAAWLRAVEDHLKRSRFHDDGGDRVYRKTLKLVSLAVAPATPVRAATATVRLTSSSLRLALTIDGKTYDSPVLGDLAALKPFLTLTASDGASFVMSPAGLLDADDSLRGPYDELVVASDPELFAAMRGLDSRIKFPLRMGADSYLVVDGDE